MTNVLVFQINEDERKATEKYVKENEKVLEELLKKYDQKSHPCSDKNLIGGLQVNAFVELFVNNDLYSYEASLWGVINGVCYDYDCGTIFELVNSLKTYLKDNNYNGAKFVPIFYTVKDHNYKEIKENLVNSFKEHENEKGFLEIIKDEFKNKVQDLYDAIMKSEARSFSDKEIEEFVKLYDG